MKRPIKLRVEFDDGTWLEATGEEADLRYWPPEKLERLAWGVKVLVEFLPKAQP